MLFMLSKMVRCHFQLCVLLFLGLAALPEYIHAKEAPIKQIVQLNRGWTVYQIATGDLNQDGTDDVVAILRKTSEDAVTLHVYLTNKFGQLDLITAADRSLCFACMGIKAGDIPFTIKVKKGIFLLTASNGENPNAGVTVSTTTKWKFKKGDFYLIGVTHEEVEQITDKRILLDANVLTLRATKKITTEISKDDPKGKVGINAKVSTIQCNVDPVYQSLRLMQFSTTKFKVPECA